MKIVKGWDDLQPYGINCVTGDQRGRRLLCDLNEKGAELVRKMLDLPIETKFRRIMLPYQLLPDLAIIALLQAGCHTVLVVGFHIVGLEGNEDADKHANILQSNYRRAPKRYKQ